MNIFKSRIESLLTKADLRPDVPGGKLQTNLQQVGSEFPFDVYKSLGGEKDWRGLKPYSADFLVGEKLLSVDGASHFNRYRLSTLRSEFYSSFKGFKKGDYQRYCRNFEKECIKAAANEKDWTNNLAEAHFGRAVEPGDFYGNGSPGWKMRAFRHFLTDHLTWLEGKTFIRISIYDTLMIDSKLIRLDKLLMTTKELYDEYLTKYLFRRLGIPYVNRLEAGSD